MTYTIFLVESPRAVSPRVRNSYCFPLCFLDVWISKLPRTLNPHLWVGFVGLGCPKLKIHKAVGHRIWHILSPCWWFEVLGRPKLKRHKSVVHRIWHTLSPWWRVSVLCSLGYETLTVSPCASWICGVPNCLRRLKLKSHKSVVHRTWHTLSTWWRAPCCPS